MNNLNMLMNLKLLEINREYIEKNINYKSKLKKKINNKIINQSGGDPFKLNIEKIEELTKKLLMLKNTKVLKDQRDKLTEQINKINNYIDKNLDDRIENIELEKIINHANMLVITENQAKNIDKENLKINISVNKELKPFKVENLHQIKSIQDILKEALDLYSSIKGYDKTPEIQKLNAQLLEIKKKLDQEKEKSKIFYDKINFLININTLDNFNFSNGKDEVEIRIEMTDPIYYLETYLNNPKIDKEEFKSLFKNYDDKIDSILINITVPLSIPNKKIFDDFRNKIDVNKIKKYLNKIFPELLLQETDVLEERIENNFLKIQDEAPLPNIKTEESKDLSNLFTLPAQIGGDLLDDLKKVIIDANTEMLKLEEIKKDLSIIVNKYNYEMNKLAYHNIFMIGVFNKLFSDELFISLNYINSGLILFYKNIVDKILSEMNKNSDNNLILYFKKYHFLNLEILKNVLDASLSKLKGENLSNIINIRKSGKNVRYAYLILNFLNTNLENYMLNSNTNVTIYARINDWTPDIKDKLFTADKNDFKILNVKEENCKKHETPILNKEFFSKQYKFTYVFGEEFDNSVLSTYMALNTLLTQKKSIAMITYGYSGTGKTFTLFGNNEKSGMLQTTISRIKGLSKGYLRIFEIYGRGFQYPFYWDQGNKNQFIYDYNIYVNDEKKLSLQADNSTTLINNDGFDNFINKPYTESLVLEGNNINNTLKNLENLVTEIDKVRKENKRIRETPNNIESSRSIIVYDFTFMIDDTPVYFLIMDLPGRENIEKTYIDNYVKVADVIIKDVNVNSLITNEIPYISKDNYTDYIKILLFATSMQPLLIPIIDPVGFLEAINDNPTEYYEKYDINEKINNLDFNKEHKKVGDIFKLKVIQEKTGRKQISIDVGNIPTKEETTSKRHVKFVNGIKTVWYEDVPGTLGKKIDLATRRRVPNENPINPNFLIANWGVFYMNVIINNNHFNILEHIIKHIIEKRFNNYIEKYCNQDNNKYIELLKLCKKNYYEKNRKNISDKYEVNRIIVLYDYFLTPYEGLYINENIVGIIKYCENINSVGRTSTVKIQDQNLDFELQKIICRGLLLNPDGVTQNVEKLHLKKEKSYYKCDMDMFKNEPTIDNEKKYYIYPLLTNSNDKYIFNFDINPEIKMTNINIMYNNLINYYDSSSIYNDGEEHYGKTKEILISKILSPYIGIVNPRIKDFKIFYLFSNESLDIKCYSQANLLELTDNFIKAIIRE
jgi:hypothetical protein